MDWKKAFDELLNLVVDIIDEIKTFKKISWSLFFKLVHELIVQVEWIVKEAGRGTDKKGLVVAVINKIDKEVGLKKRLPLGWFGWLFKFKRITDIAIDVAVWVLNLFFWKDNDVKLPFVEK
jgi:hypothetical protein